MPVIAHLSDTHLDTSAERLARFSAVLSQIERLPEVSALLVSGDLTDHGTAEEYREFFDALPKAILTIVIPGNHDLSAPMQEALLNRGWEGNLNSSLTVDGVTIIGLDSHIDNHDEGELRTDTLAFAQDAIDAASGRVLLAMHHPAVPVGHHVMDQYGLRNPDELRALLENNEQVIAVLTGHVHTALATTFAGRPLLGAPGIVSTMRLGSRTDPVADNTAAPGLALHTLAGTTLRTVFHTLSPDTW